MRSGRGSAGPSRPSSCSSLAASTGSTSARSTAEERRRCPPLLGSPRDRLLHVPQALEHAVAIWSLESLEQTDEQVLVRNLRILLQREERPLESPKSVEPLG